MQKEDWINEVLESTKGMQKAEPSPFLFEKITARINKDDFASVSTSPFFKWGLTSVLLIILMLNIFSVIKTNTTARESIKAEIITESYFNNTITYNY